MSRQRKGRSDWETFSRKKRELWSLTYGALANGVDSLTDEERAKLAAPDKPRARAVQHEDAHARILAARAYRHWWEPGFTRVEHRTSNQREAEERQVQGAKTGMPDFWLFVPDVCMCALELKAPQHAPKRPMPARWWDGDWPEPQESWHGLRRDQWRWLRTLKACGFVTFVAYGHDQAEAFLVEAAGPRPPTLPEEWT